MIGTYHPDRNATGIYTPEPPSADDVQTLVSQMAQEARSYIEEEINPKRALAIDYYFGRPFGNEEEGRSQVVSTDVRDGIQACMPGLMRTFCGSEQAIEAKPKRAEQTEAAEQQTEFARQVYFTDNNGFQITHDWLLNGLREGYGVVKAWWDEEETVTSLRYTGLSAEDLLGLQDDPMVELADVEQGDDDAAGEPVYSAMVTRIEPDGRIRVEACPPEEIIFNRTARSKDSALLFGHCKEMRVHDVIALGYTPDQIDGQIGSDDMDWQIESARNPGDFGGDDDGSGQFALRKILYSELWMLLDLDGKGRAALYKVCTVGGTFKVLNIEPAAYRPFADFVPLPEPHTILGQSWAELLTDTQRVKSALRRGTLDSLALVLNPRRVILDGAVELDDVMNTEVGALIRERVMNATRVEDHRFVGADAFPVIQYEDEIAEARTGRTKTAQGLNADSLQSTTKMAVSATVSAAHQRAELLARLFADAQKSLFKTIIKIARQHQQKARMMKLRGKWIAVDPKNWDTELDFEVCVGLGSGMVEEKKAALMEILMAQNEAMTALGPSNPMTSAGRVRNTLAKLANLAGYPDAGQFWKEVDDEAIDAAAQEAEKDPNSKKSPEDKIADAQKEIQGMKSQSDMQLKQMDLEAKKLDIQIREKELERQAQLDQEKLKLDQQKLLLDFELRKAEMEARFSADVEMNRIKAEFEQQRLIAETAAHREKAQIDAEAKRYTADKQADAAKANGTKKKISLTRDPASGRPTGATVETSGGE